MKLFILLISISGVAAAQPAPEDDDQALLERARQEMATGQVADAIRDFEIAYSIRQDPDLLLVLARAHRRLGHADQSIAYYRRYRIALTSLAPELAAEVDGAIPRPPRFVSRPNRPMLAAGAVFFATAYTASAFTGGFLTLAGGDRVAGGLLFIPFLGPFASAAANPNPVWAGPMIAVDGVAQLLGLGLMIAARYRPQMVRVLEKTQVMPYATGDKVGVRVALRF